MSWTVLHVLVRAVAAIRLPLAMLAASALVGCASSPPGGVQVVDRGQNQGRAPVVQRQPVRSGHYVVQRGDTLYSIAFRFGWDWKALAAHNGLRDPYVIRVGQTIRFDNRPVGNSQPVASAPPPTTSTVITQPVPSRPPVAVTAPPATQPARPPVANTPATTPVTPVSRSTSGWSWPTEGTVISRFSSNGSLNKGIDIAGQLGQPVLAASDGSVVYAGSGLRGYGELIIIKHSDTYVSAYGHNRRLLVREGSRSKPGKVLPKWGPQGRPGEAAF